MTTEGAASRWANCLVPIVLLVIGVPVAIAATFLTNIPLYVGLVLGLPVGIGFVLLWRVAIAPGATSPVDLAAAFLVAGSIAFWGTLYGVGPDGAFGLAAFYWALGALPVVGVATCMAWALVWRVTGHRLTAATLVSGLVIGGVINLAALVVWIEFGPRTA